MATKIAPPKEVYVFVKVLHCKDHIHQSTQGVYVDEQVANLILPAITPFGSCGICEYEVRRYILEEKC